MTILDAKPTRLIPLVFFRIVIITDSHRLLGIHSFTKINLRSFVNSDDSPFLPFLKKDRYNSYSPAAFCLLRKLIFLMISASDGIYLSFSLVSVSRSPILKFGPLNCSAVHC